MLKLTTENNKHLSIYFKYTDNDTSWCYIDVSDNKKDWKQIAKVRVKRHHEDTNNRKIGRKEAFRKAIESVTTDRSVRRELWQAYFDPINSNGIKINNFL